MRTDKKISCIIVHEEPDTRRLMEYYISKASFLQLKGSYDNAGDALALLQVEKADIITFN